MKWAERVVATFSPFHTTQTLSEPVAVLRRKKVTELDSVGAQMPLLPAKSP
jgi:hypothetical protein